MFDGVEWFHVRNGASEVKIPPAMPLGATTKSKWQQLLAYMLTPKAIIFSRAKLRT